MGVWLEETPQVRLQGPLSSWGDGVLRAEMAASRVPAAVVLGAAAVDPAALEDARRRAAGWIEDPRPGMLPLLAVVRVIGREGWVYERPDGVSVSLLTGPPVPQVPLCVAAELVARVSEVFAQLGPDGWNHPGPSPRDVLVNTDGQVLLAGFAGPVSEPFDPAAAGLGAAPLVWRLGALLAEILTGVPYRIPADRAAHVTQRRRLMVRVMARPGPVLPDHLRDLLGTMLDPDPAARPVLGTLASSLRVACAGLQGATLDRWCADQIPAVHRRLEVVQHPSSTEPTVTPADPRLPETPDPTEESFGIEPIEEVTAVSGGRWGFPDSSTRHRNPEQGTIPVGVGPPAEALPKLSRSAAELFREPTEPAPIVRHVPWPAVAMSGLLILLAILLIAHLLS